MVAVEKFFIYSPGGSVPGMTGAISANLMTKEAALAQLTGALGQGVTIISFFFLVSETC